MQPSIGHRPRVSKLWVAIYLVGVPLAFFYPSLAFPMCLQTFPLRRNHMTLYIGLTAAAFWYPPLKWLSPMTLAFGCNGAFYVDHILLCVALYATMWSDALRTTICIIIGIYYVRYKFAHDKHIQVF